MQILRNIKKIVIAIIVPAILSLSYFTVVNTHYHINAQGVIVQHSHPFTADKNSPIQHHNHTNVQLAFVALVGSFLQLLTLLFVFTFLNFFAFQRRKFIFIKENFHFFVISKTQSRAPPIQFLSNIFMHLK